MRLIGHLESESSARIFGDFLFVKGIENEVEFSTGEGWGIWINDEEKVGDASRCLSEFRQNPNDAKYQSEAAANQLREERSRDQEVWRKRLRNRRHLFRPLTEYGFGPLTFVLIVISVVVFVRSRFGEDLGPIQSLFITQFMSGGEFISPESGLSEIRQGQIWRLFTPMFIHFSPLHIFFNMLWLRDLGSMIEGRQGSLHLAMLALVGSAGSNFAQYFISHHPVFGGMSGVVYVLLGYVWIRGKLDPASGLYLHRSTVIMMLIWLVACFTNLLGPIANYAHLAGLVIGVAWGWISSFGKV
jgi:GlpG protein